MAPLTRSCGKQRLSMLKRAGLAETTMATREVSTGLAGVAQAAGFPRLTRFRIELSTLGRSRGTAILHHAARRARRDPSAHVEAIGTQQD
jgi:hypothetical protein